MTMGKKLGTKMQTEFSVRPTWLVQRLLPPDKGMGDLNSKVPFLKGKDINKAWADELRKLVQFDYMGASEFEWGSVPDALRDMHNHINDYSISHSSFPRKLVQIPSHYREGEEIFGDVTIYVLGPQEHESILHERYERLIKNVDDCQRRLKERLLSEFIRQTGHREMIAWIDLANGVLFTHKESVAKGMALLMGYE